MYSCVRTGALLGISVKPVLVEVDTSPGLSSFQMVGYLGSEVREARERIKVALRNVGVRLPPLCININLSPADLHKDGTLYDLPIAVGILIALGIVPRESVERMAIWGELGLDGVIRPIRGTLPLVRAATEWGMEYCLVPKDNRREGMVVPGIGVYGGSDLGEVMAFLTADKNSRDRIISCESGSPALPAGKRSSVRTGDLADVVGQREVKRGAEIAASGFHHFLMVGPPGAGKTMVAERIPGILPPLSIEECLEVTGIHSVAGTLEKRDTLITERPFVSPHHTVTKSALIGGGAMPGPGLISLAHKGVLFLDEMAEFRRETIDLLRQPLEEKRIVIHRRAYSSSFPADFMLVAASNPCPCGYYPDRNRCNCSENQIRTYQSRISGPVLDRIDLAARIEAVRIDDLEQKRAEEKSDTIRERVIEAVRRQSHRFRESTILFNSQMGKAEVAQYCALGHSEMLLMRQAFERMHMSARGYHRTLKVARTIADLAGEERIREEHLEEALFYRLGRGGEA